MVGWHHRLNGHDFEQAPGDGRGSLSCCSPWPCCWQLNKKPPEQSESEELCRMEGSWRGRGLHGISVRGVYMEQALEDFRENTESVMIRTS